jgi:hypothetical protein
MTGYERRKERRISGKAAQAPPVITDGLLLESDPGTETDFIALESDNGSGTNVILKEDA